MTADSGAIVLALADAVIAAPPYAAADVAARVLSVHFQADRVTIWQVDYSMRTLHAVAHWPEGDVPDAMSINAPEAAPFRSQTAVASRGASSRVVVPLTVRGHRHGLLDLSLPTEDPEIVSAAERCADMLAVLLAQASHGDDVFEIRRRSQRLSLPAELQWQILPSPGLRTDAVTVYAQLEPAHLVSSDAFDYSFDGTRLTVFALDGEGEGVGAAQATELAMTALRNARRAELPLTECVSLADQALWDETRGGCQVQFLAVEYDLTAESATLVGCGSPRLLRWQDGQLSVLGSGGDLPLGAAELSVFNVHRLSPPGEDALDLLVTDGILAAEDERGTPFGVDGVERVLKSDGASLWEIPRLIIAAVSAHSNDTLLDDAVCVVVTLSAAPTAPE